MEWCKSEQFSHGKVKTQHSEDEADVDSACSDRHTELVDDRFCKNANYG